MYEQYEHHGKTVWVRKDMKGKHGDFCLCYACELFNPNEANNCSIAEGNFQYCVEHDLVLPVWECPRFKRQEEKDLLPDLGPEYEEELPHEINWGD